MENSSLKRQVPVDLPTPAELAHIYGKRQRVEEPRSARLAGPAPAFLPWAVPSSTVSNTVPSAIIPVLQHPLQVEDFYSDLDVHRLRRYNELVQDILNRFPPPPAPPMKDDDGLAVPFIFPPPPRVKTSSLSPTLGGTATDDSDDDDAFVVVPPLPFPPPNYMPYMVRTDKGALVPQEVFGRFIEASTELPRTDMVVASAAGSLLDIKQQATDEGFVARDPSLSDDEDDDLYLEHLHDYLEYAQGVDVSEHPDPYEKLHTVVETHPPKYLPGTYWVPKQRVSNRGNEPPMKVESPSEFSSVSASSLSPSISNPSKDIILGNGVNKERRREELVASLNQLGAYQHDHEYEVYAARKQRLLDRLHSLKQTKITFGNQNTSSWDPELRAYSDKLALQRDHDLLQLKVYHNYKSLEATQHFYEDSNRYFRAMNGLVLNKLQKLKQFFEFQKSTFSSIKDNHEVLDLRNKDSAKLYGTTSHKDYNASIKAVLHQEAPTVDHEVPEDVRDDAIMSDFMPLVTDEEFNLITGDAPTKAKPTKEVSGKNKNSHDIKHQIFQSPLYEHSGSNSDSNSNTDGGQTSGTPAKRRPGRRNVAAMVSQGVSVNPDKKHTEAHLLNKIMKQFTGPQAAKSDELLTDLDILGIDTKWPVR